MLLFEAKEPVNHKKGLWLAGGLLLSFYGEAWLSSPEHWVDGDANEYVVIRDLEPEKPPLSDIRAAPSSPLKREKGFVKKKTDASLRRWGLGPRNRSAITTLMRTENIQFKLGQCVDVYKDSVGRVQKLTWTPSLEKRIELSKVRDGYWKINAEKYQLKTREVAYQGKVKTHLLEALGRQGITQPIGKRLIKILGEVFDVRRRFSRGTYFNVIVQENYVNETAQKKQIDILALWIHAPRQTTISAYKFGKSGEKVAYFNEQGIGLSPSFLASPVTHSRISSKFGMRKHPISGLYKMHPAIDFAAPIGTPIRAVADGKVEKAHYTRGYGHYIRLRHKDGYQTAYAHLQRYAKGVSSGRHVNQGDTIGYVGKTGHATGPHLHFEVLKHGRHINPQKVLLHPAINLKGPRLREFCAHIQDLKQRHPRWPGEGGDLSQKAHEGSVEDR